MNGVGAESHRNGARPCAFRSGERTQSRPVPSSLRSDEGGGGAVEDLCMLRAGQVEEM